MQRQERLIHKWSMSHVALCVMAEQATACSTRHLGLRKTRLPVKDHVHVMKQIKIARVMGLMAHEARLEKQHLKLIREKELKEAQERGLL